MDKEDCVFCKIVQRKIKSEIIKSSNNFIAIRDIHPKTEGHTLIIPKKHYVTLLDLSNSLGEELLQFLKDVAFDLMNKKLGDGFNLIMNNLEPAGQVVEHAHIHIIPRKEGDRFRSGV